MAKQLANDHANDEALMLTYAAGNALAFEQLYHRHKQKIFNFFIKQGLVVAIAEELCHDTWLKVINARNTYQHSAKFSTYLFTVARHIYIDHCRKKSNQNEQTDIIIDAVAQDKADNMENIELSRVLAKNIAALKPQQREVFLLKQESGFNIEEIASITKAHKEKVKSCWRYALKKMRRGLEDYV